MRVHPERRIFFYNHYHNGDVFYSREFVRDMMAKAGGSHVYLHRNDPSIFKDFGIDQAPMEGHAIDEQKPFFDDGESIYINTWVGQSELKFASRLGCSLMANYAMYSKIYEALGISMEPMDFYIPRVDFDKVGRFKVGRGFVLVCNNMVMSGQSSNFDFDPVVEKLSRTYGDKMFVMTNETSVDRPNVARASEIIGFDKGNLLEISRLSTFASVIVGRASGPFCFSHIVDNMSDPKKSFVGLTLREENSKWVPDSISKAKQLWLNAFDEPTVSALISRAVENE